MAYTLLTDRNYKTQKGEGLGYLTGILHLAPYKLSGRNVCAYASAGCIGSCLNTAGRGKFSLTQNARIRKTELWFSNRSNFLATLYEDCRTMIRKAERNGLIPCLRPNGTSDLPALGHAIARKFPDVQVYDYTKIPEPWKRELPNYRLIFSRSEKNHAECMAALQHGISVAVVSTSPAPKRWHGYPVVVGDDSDLRFLEPAGSVVWLYPKGKARHDMTGFVLR